MHNISCVSFTHFSLVNLVWIAFIIAKISENILNNKSKFFNNKNKLCFSIRSFGIRIGPNIQSTKFQRGKILYIYKCVFRLFLYSCKYLTKYKMFFLVFRPICIECWLKLFFYIFLGRAQTTLAQNKLD